MDKTVVLKIILKSAKLYSQNLENRNMLFLFDDKEELMKHFEVIFEPRHFHHFTGTKIVNPNIKSTVDFYNMCLRNQLSLNDFQLSVDGTTPLKMSVLPQLMEIHKLSKMIGDYNKSKRLYTEKLAGNIRGCMGFVQEGYFFAPNTILKEDIRNVSVKANKLVAVYAKQIKDSLYNHLCYLAKGIDVKDVKTTLHIKEKIDMDNLITDF